MKAFVLDGGFGLENLRLRELPTPAPGPGQVRLRMLAASLNYRDVLMARGLYNPRQRLPLIVASDGVGTVDAVGEGVTQWKPGDRVCPNFVQGWISGEPTRDKLRTSLGGPLDGTLAEYRVFDASSVVAVPAALTDEAAATLPCAGLTAWSALVTQGRLTAADTVLVLGTGGVSIFTLQIAKLVGARVLVTSSSDEKLARARALGADETVNYRTVTEWGKWAKELTGGRGVDHVMEVGGAGTLEQSLRAVRIGGTVSIVGVLAGTAPALNLLPVLMQNIRLQGVIVGHREGFEEFMRAIDHGPLTPVVDRTFPFEDTVAAFEHLASGSHFGKLAIRIAS